MRFTFVIFPRALEVVKTALQKTRSEMSLIPFLLRDRWNDWDERPSRLLDQHFGMSLTRDDLLRSVLNVPPRRSLLNRYYRPWDPNFITQDAGSTVKVDKDKYEVILDVQQFAPNEITVKINNNNIVVEGKHEEKEDEHGFISRQFVRRYVLPELHDADKIQSTLSSDGVLTITAPKLEVLNGPGEKVIPITQTGPVKTENPKIETKK